MILKVEFSVEVDEAKFRKIYGSEARTTEEIFKEDLETFLVIDNDCKIRHIEVNKYE